MVLGRTNVRLAAASLAMGALAGSLHGQANEQWYVTPSSGTASQRAGMAMDVEGNVMVVGAPYEDTKANDAGAVDVFRFDPATKAWNLEQQLFASDFEASARFGSAVGVGGDLIVVGSPYKDTTKGTDGGQIYIFRYDSGTKTWSQEQKLLPSVGGANDYFGSAVAISGNLAIVGAPRSDTTAGTDAGSAFAFRYKNSIVKWVEEKQLLDNDGGYSDYAGTTVDVAGSLAVIGSPGSIENANYGAGSVAIWSVSGSTWTQNGEVLATTPSYYASFGSKIRLNGDLLTVTCPGEDESASIIDSGSVYLFRNVAGTFTLEERFTAASPASYTYFGTDAVADGKLVVIGNQSEDVSGKGDSGAAFTFRQGKSGVWFFDQQLGASDFSASDRLGAQVGLHADQILVAAEGNDTGAGSDWGVIYGYVRDEITLSISPRFPTPSETMTFSAFRGTPGDVCMVTIEDVDGIPFFIPLLVYVFAADHTLTFTADAPNPLYGVTVGFRSYKISPTGPVVFSDLALVDV